MAVSSWRSRCGQRIVMSKDFLAFDHLRNGLAADGGLDDVVHVGHADVPQRAFLPIDRQFEVRLSLDAIQADVLDARHRR